MATPRSGLGADDRAPIRRATSVSSCTCLRKLRGLDVIGDGSEPLVSESSVDGLVGGQGPTQSSNRCAVTVADPAPVSAEPKGTRSKRW